MYVFDVHLMPKCKYCSHSDASWSRQLSAVVVIVVATFACSMRADTTACDVVQVRQQKMLNATPRMYVSNAHWKAISMCSDN